MTKDRVYARFRAKFVKHPSGCWLWTGAGERYGDFMLQENGRQRKTKAHRWSYEYFNKTTIPEGLCILHICDAGKCVNPAHLRLGTQRDSVLDMFQKGRANRGVGERNGRARLTEEAVLAIRESIRSGNVTTYALAAQYGITRPNVKALATGKTWAHVPNALSAEEWASLIRPGRPKRSS